MCPAPASLIHKRHPAPAEARYFCRGKMYFIISNVFTLSMFSILSNYIFILGMYLILSKEIILSKYIWYSF